MRTDLDLLALLEAAVAKVRAMTPSEREEMHRQQRESWVRGELGLPETAVVQRGPFGGDAQERGRVAYLEERLDELQRTFDLRWEADMRAVRRWQEAGGDPLTFPDRADLVLWLLERLEQTTAHGVIVAETTCMCGDPIAGHAATSGHTPVSMAEHMALLRAPATEHGGVNAKSLQMIEALLTRVADLELVLQDKRRLMRELDVVLHGEKGAAEQASLCDLIWSARELRRRAEQS